MVLHTSCQSTARSRISSLEPIIFHTTIKLKNLYTTKCRKKHKMGNLIVYSDGRKPCGDFNIVFETCQNSVMLTFFYYKPCHRIMNQKIFKKHIYVENQKSSESIIASVSKVLRINKPMISKILLMLKFCAFSILLIVYQTQLLVSHCQAEESVRFDLCPFSRVTKSVNLQAMAKIYLEYVSLEGMIASRISDKFIVLSTRSKV